MRVICFGDSNTYGYDPRSYFGGRYDPDCRWVDLLAEKTGWNIRNEGMNGRQIPARGPGFTGEWDLIIIMLGTNDLLQGITAEDAARRMEAFLSQLNTGMLLLISPPSMKPGAWVQDSNLIRSSRELGALYQNLAARLGISFVDADSWNIPLTFDGVHFTEESHIRFAQCLYQILMQAQE